MNYVFRGHVIHVGQSLCWLHMIDQTDRANPDEEWCVPLARLPIVPAQGQYFTFTIRPNRGTFKFDNRKWTAKELEAAKKRAEHWAKLFGLPQSVDAVDPHAGSTGTPTPRDETSSAACTSDKDRP